MHIVHSGRHLAAQDSGIRSLGLMTLLLRWRKLIPARRAGCIAAGDHRPALWTLFGGRFRSATATGDLFHLDGIDGSVTQHIAAEVQD